MVDQQPDFPLDPMAAASNLRTQPRQQRCVLDVDALDAYEP